MPETNALYTLLGTLREGLTRYGGKTVVVKYGGSAMTDPALKAMLLEDLALLRQLGLRMVLCHGGGPGINRMMERLEVPVEFVDGLRRTTPETMRVVEAVLAGQINTELTAGLNALGARAVGLSGVSGNLFLCRQKNPALGLVGEVTRVDPSPVEALLEAGFLPVVAPVGTDGAGERFNINGDTAAGALAGALRAEKFLLLTDIAGVCNDPKAGDVISYLNADDIPRLRAQGTLAGGMIPKTDCCVQALDAGVREVHILDGRRPHCLLSALFAQGENGTAVGRGGPSVGAIFRD